MRVRSFINNNAYLLVFGGFFLLVFSPNLFYKQIQDDEASYLSHALTLGLDGDLDYSNEPVDNWSKNHLMPQHPIGSGILAAPFVALLSIIDRITGQPIINNHNNYLGSWSLFGYVFAVNVLFLCGIYFYIRSIQLMKLNVELRLIILFIFSSTIPFFVMNRYFLSHGFEFFAVALLFWCVVAIYNNVKNGESPKWHLYLFGSLSSLNLFIRYSNINLFLLGPITFMIMYLIDDNRADARKRQIFKYIYLLPLISLISCTPNLCYYYFQYGSILPRPSLMYNKPFWLESYTFIQIITILIKRIPYILNITFGSEMGLLYTNPIIPIGFVSVILFTLYNKREKKLIFYKLILVGLILLFIGYAVSVHLWWQEMGSSYGYRYLLQSFPIALIGVVLVYNYLRANSMRYFQYYKRSLLVFCTISVVSMVFFASTQNLQLKEQVNTFNVQRSHSGNGYILDLPKEIVNPYTWIRLVNKNSLGYLLSPVILQYDLPKEMAFLLLLSFADNNEQVRDDYNKYLSRSSMLDYNKIIQLLILFSVWVFAGAAFQNYQRKVNNEYKNE